MINRQNKVLILSGGSHMIEAVEIAKQLGLYTVVADNIIASPAKKYADQSYNVSPSNIEQLAEIARIEKIDGVFNAFDDINTWHALALCKKLDLPFYATSRPLTNCPSAHRFKEYCRSFNVPVIEDNIKDGLYEKEVALMEFPMRLSRRLPSKKSLQVI